LKVWRDLRVKNICDSASIQEKLSTLSKGATQLSGIQLAEYAIALAIIAEHSFFLKQQDSLLMILPSIEIAIDDFSTSLQYFHAKDATRTLEIGQLEESQPLIPVVKAICQKLGLFLAAQEKTAIKSLQSAMAQIVLDHGLNPCYSSDFGLD